MKRTLAPILLPPMTSQKRARAVEGGKCVLSNAMFEVSVREDEHACFEVCGGPFSFYGHVAFRKHKIAIERKYKWDMEEG